MNDAVHVLVEPLPPCLLSDTCWDTGLTDEESPAGSMRRPLLESASGSLRTWRYLVKHRLDLISAQAADVGLVAAN